ncbi:methyltransferase [Salmonella enterica subsp. enterica serovar Gloucester]|nr:methyltransferase [Salmonella enterica subsp. enterica serovar Gloucester]
MAKLTKQQTKLHQQSLDLIFGSDKPLTFDEVEFCLSNYCGDAVGSTGAFFTPEMLAWDFIIDAGCTGDCIDLCAGIGRLSYYQWYRNHPKRLVCVELNHEYVEIGKRLLPAAEWYCQDVFTYPTDQHFDVAFGNPPFGKIKTSDSFQGKYKGSEFEYKVIEFGSKIADYGVFIVPQGSAGFRYSGAHYYERTSRPKYEKFVQETGFYLDAGCGIDTKIYENEWHGTKVICEIACCDYSERFDNVEGRV